MSKCWSNVAGEYSLLWHDADRGGRAAKQSRLARAKSQDVARSIMQVMKPDWRRQPSLDGDTETLSGFLVQRH